MSRLGSKRWLTRAASIWRELRPTKCVTNCRSRWSPGANGGSRMSRARSRCSAPPSEKPATDAPLAHDAAMRGPALLLPWPPETDRDRAPYRGLKPLETVDGGIFFGRDAAIAEGIERIRSLRAIGGTRLLVILGASGAGKSSFLRAGILPQLEADGRHFVPCR